MSAHDCEKNREAALERLKKYSVPLRAQVADQSCADPYDNSECMDAGLALDPGDYCSVCAGKLALSVVDDLLAAFTGESE